MKPHLNQRTTALQQEMRENGLDAVVFADRENLIYYAGAVEIECMAMVIPVEGDPVFCCLWLDEPYVREVTASENIEAYYFPASNIGACIVEALKSLDLPSLRVGFHKYFVEFSIFDALRKAFPEIEWRPVMELTYKVRSVKDADELRRISKACTFLEEGMRAAVDAVKPGVTEVDVLAEADYAMRKAGSEGATFRMQVLSWPKQLLAHPFAGNTVLENNQPVVIHLGASFEGYAAKMCRTVFLGDVPGETLRVYTTLAQAQDIAAAALRPGVTAAQVYTETAAYIAEQGYAGRFLDVIGYGVGIRQSEFYPVIQKNTPHVIKENMVVDLLLPTIYKPGVGGPRVTDMLRVTNCGAVYLTKFSRDPLLR